MASEKNASLLLTATKGNATVQAGPLAVTYDMTGADMATGTQAVGTSAEALATPGDLSYPADVVIKNNDTTNFVTVYQDSGGTYQVSKLLPGKFCLLTAVAAVPYVKADTAACQIQWWAWEV